METLVIVGVVLLILAVWQRRNFGRVMTAVSAQIGKATNLFWSADPVAVYQAEVDHAAGEISEATAGLEQYRGEVSGLERRVAKGEKDEATLMARIKVALNNKDEARAADHAVQLKQVQGELATARDSLASYNESYQNNLKKIKYARAKIEDRRTKARELNAELKMSRVDAQMAKISEKFNVKASSLDGLGEVEDEIHRQIDLNKGKAQVAHDLSSEGLAEIEEQEAIQRAEAKDLLEKVKVDMGIK
jgi:phage shock protein A